MRNILIIISILFCININAQEGYIEIKGNIQDDSTGVGLASGKVEISYFDSTLIQTIITGSGGKYKFNKVEIGKNYKITFSKNGFVSKYFIVETDGINPEDKGVFPLEISTNLFKEDGKDYAFLSYVPIAYCKYEKSVDNLMWDFKYFEKIKELIDSVKNKK